MRSRCSIFNLNEIRTDDDTVNTILTEHSQFGSRDVPKKVSIHAFGGLQSSTTRDSPWNAPTLMQM